MSEILVNTIKKADGTGSITVPADTGTVLTTATAASSIPGYGNLTGADVWRLTADKTSSGDITSNLERADDASSGLIGTGMTESSGVFTFPETGIWQVSAMFGYSSTSGNIDTIFVNTYVSTDGGSSYDQVTFPATYIEASASVNTGNSSFALVDCTSTANVKVKFNLDSLSVGGLKGDTNYNRTAFLFIRLGDT